MPTTSRNPRYHPSNPLHATDWTVEPIPIATARYLVERFHYAHGASNTACYTFGLIHRASRRVYGCSWWLPPTRACAEFNCAGRPWQRVLSLSRLAIANTSPPVPTNAASFLISRSVKAIRLDARFDVLVTFADEWQGHTGRIYLACGWEYRGMTSREPTYVDETGRLTARKAGPITYTNPEMVSSGFRVVGRFAKHRYRLILR